MARDFEPSDVDRHRGVFEVLRAQLIYATKPDSIEAQHSLRGNTRPLCRNFVLDQHMVQRSFLL